ncbi:uncharacterized protein LOC121786878 [Salvia splendens]|uniref:uncharacterized protein LOC121786878 n=1 Tax=Salvia splendens TaxID=180675 RepID=UPI001C270BEE|nr:uncharacterized protein LOC121786878 [Salvia splendens]
MASLQKLKLLATQCAVARSPTRSPVIHLRRRTTLRMLLGRGDRRLPRRCDRNDEERSVRVSHKLKDLFVSSPPSENIGERLMPSGGGRRGGARSMSATFRQRLLRRPWRPVLVPIPE